MELILPSSMDLGPSKEHGKVIFVQLVIYQLDKPSEKPQKNQAWLLLLLNLTVFAEWPGLKLALVAQDLGF